MIADTVERIGALIDEAARIQQPHAARVCPQCKAPCCARVHYLYTEKDVLYLKLSGRRPVWRREGFMKGGCWFLGPAGCTLELGSRPLICHTYVCRDLESAIRESGTGLMVELEEMFKTIGTLRSHLWAEYLDDVRSRP